MAGLPTRVQHLVTEQNHNSVFWVNIA